MEDRDPLNAEALTFVQGLFSAARHGLTHSELSHLLAQFYLEEAQSRGDRSLLEVARSSADIKAIEILEDLEEQGLVEAGDMVRTQHPERLWSWVGPLPDVALTRPRRFHKRLARLFQGRKTFIGDERRVSEEPYHQIRSGSLKLAAQTLGLIQFIQSKCTFGRYEELVQDYQDLIGALMEPVNMPERTVLPIVEAFRDYLVVHEEEILFHTAEKTQGNWLVGMLLRDDPAGPLGRQARHYAKASSKPFLLLLRVSGAPPQACVTGEDDGNRFTALGVAAHADRFVAGHASGKLSLWQFSSIKPERIRKAGEGEVTCIDVTADGTRAVSGHETGELFVIDLIGNAKARLVTEDDEEVTAVALSPDGRLAAAGNSQGDVRIVDLDTGAEVRRLGLVDSRVTAVRFSCDGLGLAWTVAGHRSAAENPAGKLVLSDLRTGKSKYECALESAPMALGFPTPGRAMWVGLADGTLRRFDAGAEKTERRLARDGHFGSVCATGGADAIVTGGNVGTLRFWQGGRRLLAAHRCGDAPVQVGAFWSVQDMLDSKVAGARIAAISGDELFVYWMPMQYPGRQLPVSHTAWISAVGRAQLRSGRRIVRQSLQPYETEDDGLIYLPASMPLTWCSHCGHFLPVHPAVLQEPEEGPWRPPAIYESACTHCERKLRFSAVPSGTPPGTSGWWEQV